ncbi:helix-hairpin-helix domain-containing protein [Streptomyces sp. NPDC048172]|uniref:helix-hairpin-helix domain-containing protein n=1 Tax=Streptomyces sp. NPDC048172 TaxID=3365505 RepID=UPI003718A178
MPRAEAIAAAREAVRQSRLRREGEREGEQGWAREPERRPEPEEAPEAESGAGLPARERARLAMRERLPVWLQLRCGMELRTLVALGLVLLIAVGFAVHHFWVGRPQSVAAPERSRQAPVAPAAGEDPPDLAAKAGAGAAPGRRLVIDVAGKVREPGVHRLPSGSRVADALHAAGGLRKGADTGTLNRARLLVDGEQIVVAGRGKGGAAAVPAPSPGAPPTAPGGTGSADASGAASGTPVSLNSATPEQLETLPGVGPVLAQHIIEFRTEHGGFTSIDQLREVNGIGEKRFADMKPQVTP